MKCTFQQILRSNFIFLIGASTISFNNFFQCSLPSEPIEITSDRAVYKKNNKELLITYTDNVRVVIPQKGVITAQTLETILNVDSLSPKDMSLENCKSIRLSGKVEIKHESHKASADDLIVYLKNNECILKGHVILEQKDSALSPVPLKTECNEAKINLDSWNISLMGKKNEPVKTVLSLNSLKKNDSLKAQAQIPSQQKDLGNVTKNKNTSA